MKTSVKTTKFDAEFDTGPCDATNNAELTITLKLGFRQINPAGGSNTGTYHDYGDVNDPSRNIVKWSDPTWRSWMENFCRSAQSFWNGKFWLLNNIGAHPYDVKGTVYIPNVYCKFKLVGGDGNSGTHHHIIDVVRLAASEKWFGSHWKLYDNKDTELVEKATASDGKKIMQRAHVHEIGHLLGLQHVDVGTAACPASGDTNASACYGTSDASKYDVMGGGMTRHEWHGRPWVEAMVEVHKKLALPTLYKPPALKLLMNILTPYTVKMQRHYPRTTKEYEDNKLITSR